MDDLRICTRCIMDSTVPGIKFNDDGTCNYCTEVLDNLKKRLANKREKEVELKRIVCEIKRKGKKKEYDCVIGLSGGIDSSYALYIVKKLGLRPLVVHLDNGWNTKTSVSNIEKLCKSLNVDLYTYVINWEEFKDLQISFFKANVVDIEMITDHAIIALLYKTAFKKKIKYIIAGTNCYTEGMRMPQGWNYLKLDSLNIKSIYKNFGSGKKLESFPLLGIVEYYKYKFFYGIKWISILDYQPYDKNEAIQILTKEIGWNAYGEKHYESIFTRFYQGYILPQKFNIDKRKIHYSMLICSGQMRRDEALKLMSQDAYGDTTLLQQDKYYVLKKLGFSEEWFENYLKSPPIPHSYYLSSKRIIEVLRTIKNTFKKVILWNN